jgi:hypothetical protein
MFRTGYRSESSHDGVFPQKIPSLLISKRHLNSLVEFRENHTFKWPDRPEWHSARKCSFSQTIRSFVLAPCEDSRTASSVHSFFGDCWHPSVLHDSQKFAHNEPTGMLPWSSSLPSRCSRREEFPLATFAQASNRGAGKNKPLGKFPPLVRQTAKNLLKHVHWTASPPPGQKNRC